VDQSVEIIGKRVNQLGLVEPSIQRQGNDRILVQVPGLGDPQQLLDILGKTAKLTFRLVDTSMPVEQALQGRPPPDADIVYGSKAENRQPYLLEKRVIVSGEELTDAQPGFDQRTSEPIVSFKFNTSGARKFAQVTQENVGRPFAIVLDDEVISAPVIREPILGGSGQISGSFTVESANNLAILLRAGALPAKLTVIEQRVVGAGLGQDSIEKGKLASYFGAALVAVFMVVTYGLFGVFATVAVAVNVGMIFGILSLAQRHAHVARHHRHRPHHRDCGRQQRAHLRAHPRRGPHRPHSHHRHRRRLQPGARDHPGLQHHHLHRRCGLFFFGSGPVRGFAVTLGIGIVTTVFTAFTLTRLIVAWWVRWARPRQLAIS
jgi:preprotein translocase subunit SecD